MAPLLFAFAMSRAKLVGKVKNYTVSTQVLAAVYTRWKNKS